MILLIVSSLILFSYLLAVLADKFDKQCGSGKWPGYIQHTVNAFKAEFSEKQDDYAYTLETEAGL